MTKILGMDLDHKEEDEEEQKKSKKKNIDWLISFRYGVLGFCNDGNCGILLVQFALLMLCAATASGAIERPRTKGQGRQAESGR